MLHHTCSVVAVAVWVILVVVSYTCRFDLALDADTHLRTDPVSLDNRTVICWHPAIYPLSLREYHVSSGLEISVLLDCRDDILSLQLNHISPHKTEAPSNSCVDENILVNTGSSAALASCQCEGRKRDSPQYVSTEGVCYLPTSCIQRSVVNVSQ